MPSPSARRRALRALGGLAVVGALTLSGCGMLDGGGDEPERDDEGQVTEEVEDGDVFAIEVGDCLGESNASGEVSEVQITPCDEPHASQAFFAFDLTGDAFPGTEAIEAEAARCQEEFETFVGVPFEESSLQVNYYSPTEESWDVRDDREILCLVYDPAGETTGSLEDSER